MNMRIASAARNIGTLAAVVVAVSSCSATGSDERTHERAARDTMQVTEPTAAPRARVTLPQVAGVNGEIVDQRLEALGLTNVTFASQDRDDKVVILPENWTAVRIEPAAGTEVWSDEPVVVTMTKGGAPAARSGGVAAQLQEGTFSDGVYEIGTGEGQIPPGKYRSDGGEGPMGTYFATLKNNDGELGDIVDQKIVNGPMTVVVPKPGKVHWVDIRGGTFRKVG